MSVLGGDAVLAGSDMAEDFQAILFPTAHILTKNQENDIEHLRLHVYTGGDIFVTINSNDFISRGRQEKLASFGVWVFLPDAIVSLVRYLYNWP
jgi:hypothetical protein